MYEPDHILDQDKITKIKNLLKFRPKGLTISDISQQLKMNRNSVAKYLEILLISGHVEMRSFGAAKVFFISNRIPISALLSFSSDHILVLDNNLRILQINDNFLTFLNIEKDALVGKNFQEPALSFLQELPFQAILKKKPEERELAAEISVLKNGTRYYFWVKVIPTVFDDGGQGLTVILEDITRQRKAQQELIESQEKFKSMIELSPFPISIINPQGIYQYLNKKFVKIFGYSLADIPTGRDWFRLAFPDLDMRRTAVRRWVEDLERSRIGEVRPRTFRVYCKDGKYREVIFHPVTLLDGTQCIVYEDITEKKRAEQVQAFLAAIVASSQDAIIGKDLNGTIISWNCGAEQMYGYTAQEMLGKSIKVLIPPEKIHEYNLILAKVRKGEETKDFETQRIRKDGTIIDVSVSVSPVREEPGTIIAASTITRDITERKRFEQELRIKEAAIASSGTGIAIARLDDTISYANESFLHLYGLSSQELIGKPVSWLASTGREELRSISTIIPVIRTEGMWEGESQLTREGRVMDFHVSGNLVRDETGNPLGMIATVIDLTHLKKIEKELNLNKQKLQEVIDFLPDPTFVIDNDKKVIGWNQAMEELTGVAASEMIGKGDYTYATPFYGNSRPLLVDLIDKSEEEIQKDYPEAHKVKDSVFTQVYVPQLSHGQGAYVWAKASPLYDQEGRPIGAIETIRDISDWKRAEESLKKAHARLESQIEERIQDLRKENGILHEELERYRRLVNGKHRN
ncbi:MAG: PAS domain S-box protein [Methanomicrobiales archaeon]|nr:PAS domain S-box protein [Methanomicrobiales archaeon]